MTLEKADELVKLIYNTDSTIISARAVSLLPDPAPDSWAVLVSWPGKSFLLMWEGCDGLEEEAAISFSKYYSKKLWDQEGGQE